MFQKINRVWYGEPSGAPKGGEGGRVADMADMADMAG